jgi:hypothetical protein
MNRKWISHSIDAVEAILFVFFLITAELNIAPASFIIEWYCHLLNTNEYYPMAISLMVTVSYLLPANWIKKRFLAEP